MQKPLLIGSLVLTLLAGVFGFLSKSKFTGLRQEVVTATDTLKANEGKLKKADTDMKAAEAQAKDAVAKLEVAVTDATAAKAEAQTAKAQAADFEKQLADKSKQIDDLTKRLATEPGAAPGEQAAPAQADLDAKLKEAETKLAEQIAINQAFISRASEAEAKADALQKEKTRRERQLIAKGLEGQVLAVNQAWNFVVLSIGDRQGVVTNAEMIVKRGDTMVGKIRITSVEPSTSIADVVPGSVRQGLRVLPGDSVIYAGS